MKKFSSGGIFTPNIQRVSNPKPAGRPFSQSAVKVAGAESPRSVFRGPRQPELPKAQKVVE